MGGTKEGISACQHSWYNGYPMVMSSDMMLKIGQSTIVDDNLAAFPGTDSAGKIITHGSRWGEWLLKLLLMAGIVCLALVNVLSRPFPRRAPGVETVWSSKPVLGYFVMTASLAELLQQELDFSEDQFQALRQIAMEEVEQIQALEAESQVILQDPGLDLNEKRVRITEMCYNEQVLELIEASQRSLELTLGNATYTSLLDWIEDRWIVERILHGIPKRSLGARTYRVFATRYDSGGAYTVALPDQCVKFANAGNHVCDEDGYQVGQDYSVYLSYESAAVARVLESGPWNIDDNYWATLNDPTPRRLFADLPLGMPEAQAAYFNNYNGGVDQFGRVVTAPYGIDLARQVSIDIGLMPGTNDWIDVSFLWTEGWGSADAPLTPGSDKTVTPGPTIAKIVPVEVATPRPDGSIIHVVQQGQALLHIATAYGVDLSELLRLNDLGVSAIIYPGNELIIKPVEATPTPTVMDVITNAATAIKPSATPRLYRTPVVKTPTTEAEALSMVEEPQLAIKEEQSSQRPSALAVSQAGIDPILLIIAVLIVVGTALVLYGSLIRRGS